MTLPEMVRQSAADPSYLLSGYAMVAVFAFVMSAVFGKRGLWWSIIDGACAAGVLTLAISPIYGWLAHDVIAGFLVGLTGLLSIIGPVIVYRGAKNRPIEDLFRDKNEDEDE